jgi:PEP-CTERM motif
MKSKLSLLALALLTSTSSFAAVITVDDFEIAQATGSSPGGTSSTSAVGGTYWTSRSLTVVQTASGTTDSTSLVRVVNSGTDATGQLIINNPTGASSDTTVVWNFNAALQAIIASATNISFTIESTSQDVNTVTISGTGSAVRTVGSPSIAITTLVLGSGATTPYSLMFSTGLAVDTTFDNLKMNYSCATGNTLNERTGVCTPPAQVPVPGSLALLGLGLVALARRKSA